MVTEFVTNLVIELKSDLTDVEENYGRSESKGSCVVGIHRT